MDLISQCDIVYSCTFSHSRFCSYYKDNPETIFCGLSDGLSCGCPEAQRDALLYELEALYGLKIDPATIRPPEEEKA